MLGKTYIPGISKVIAIGNRPASGVTARFSDSGNHLFIGFGQSLIGQCFQLFHLGFGQSQFIEHGLNQWTAISVLTIHQTTTISDTTHDNSLVEQAVRCGSLHKGSNLSTTARLTKDGHIFRISAKAGNIIMYPL